MRQSDSANPDSFAGLHLQEIASAEKNLKRLERRDWWVWWTAITVMLLLTLAVIVVTLPSLFHESEEKFQFNLSLAVHALVGLVLLFNVYALYQQWLIKKLRRQTAEQLAALAQLKNRAEQFHAMATRDPLTGLSNRRMGEERLAAEVARSERHGHPLSILLLDLNQFKQINDCYGHAAGDFVLKTFGERLSKAIRASDLAVRLGGDEFLLILPECPPERIPLLVARVGGFGVNFQGACLEVSSAAGWAGYAKGETPGQFIERADKALYANKRGADAGLISADQHR